MKSMGKARGLRHNNALQRTRVRPAGGRSPLSFETFGATRQLMKLVLWMLVYSAAMASLASSPETAPPPSFEELFARSRIVAIVRIEFGAVGSFSSQIYRGRVTEVFKGLEKDRAVYFWGGNVGGGDSYLIGEAYLVMLHGGSRSVGGALAAGPDRDAALYETATLNGPIRFRRDDRLDPSQSVFAFGGTAVTSGIAGRGWVGRKEMVEYLGTLATKAAKQ